MDILYYVYLGCAAISFLLMFGKLKSMPERVAFLDVLICLGLCAIWPIVTVFMLWPSKKQKLTTK